MLKCLWVGLGGCIGSICRYLVGAAFLPVSALFPVGTLIINLAGSFALGVLTEFSSRIMPVNTNLSVFLTVGVCGGFTTFSTFSLETVSLIEKGRVNTAILYAGTSVILCLIGVITGKSVIRYFSH